jgi:hypothetical protein
MKMNKLSFFILILSLFAACTSSTNEATTTNIHFLNSPAKSSSGEPHLFTDDTGTVYLSWIEKTDKRGEFKFSTLKDNQWSGPILIDSGSNWFVNWADYPMIASSRGKFVAHYLEKSGEGTYAYDVKITTSLDSGKTWKSASILHDDGKEAEHGFVSLVPYGDNFLVTWLDGRNTVMEGMEGMDHEGHHGSMSLRAAIIDQDGNKLKEWELDNKTCDCCQTTAAITENGPIVIYRDRSDEEIRDMSIVRLVGETWTKPQSIFQDNWKIAGCPVNGPRSSSIGNSLATAWFSAPEGKAMVNVIFSTDGGVSFGKPVRIDEGSAIGRVDIVMLDANAAMVSWMEGSEIKVVKVSQDGSKGEAVSISSSSEGRSSGFPQMTKSGNNLIFAWTDDREKVIKTASLTLN